MNSSAVMTTNCSVILDNKQLLDLLQLQTALFNDSIYIVKLKRRRRKRPFSSLAGVSAL